MAGPVRALPRRPFAEAMPLHRRPLRPANYAASPTRHVRDPEDPLHPDRRSPVAGDPVAASRRAGLRRHRRHRRGFPRHLDRRAPPVAVPRGAARRPEIGRAHVRTPATNANLVCRLLIAKNTITIYTSFVLLRFITLC